MIRGRCKVFVHIDEAFGFTQIGDKLFTKVDGKLIPVEPPSDQKDQE